jgi:aspartate--ammonia ligase
MKVMEFKKTRTIEKEAIVIETKQIFEQELKSRLNLSKVDAPLFVPKDSGLNDNLNGVEAPVTFKLNDVEHEIVHSLAKWKRWYLGELDLEPGKGIVTDMKAIRASEVLTEIHSHFVDQWDWEKVIQKESRTIESLIDHGVKVFEALRWTEKRISSKFDLVPRLPDTITTVHTENLLEEFPELSPKNREHAVAKKYGAVLLIGIGGKLSNGEVHDLRAPDYDDWSTKDKYGRAGLNADILVWDSLRGKSLEISSMGVRVDEGALLKQLKELGCEDRIDLPFHRALLNGELPYTIGGGIGQSRVAMFVSKEKDIKQVQPIY